METVTDFIFGGSKITADSDCSHEIKRRLLLGTWNLEKICVTELGAKPKKRNRMVATVTIVTGSPREVSLAEQGRPHAHAETLPLCQRGS